MNIEDYSFPEGNVIWGTGDIAAICHLYGLPVDSRLQTLVAVCYAESGGFPLALSKVHWNPGQPTHLSMDVGLWQLNSHYHTVTGPYPDVPPITFAQCLDPHESTKQAMKVWMKDRPDTFHYNLKPWTTYKTGAYDEYMEFAYEGVEQLKVWLAT